VLSVDGRADQVLKPGDWFEIPAEVPHSVRCDGGRAGHMSSNASKTRAADFGQRQGPAALDLPGLRYLDLR
jgi:quercetin dioxygenase-like cupin family protein